MGGTIGTVIFHEVGEFITRHTAYNKHDTGWAKGVPSEDHTTPPSSRTASDGRGLFVVGGAPCGGHPAVFFYFFLCLFENKPTPSFLSSKKPPAAIHTGASDPIHRPAHTLSLSLQPSVTPLAACRQSLFARSSRACRACLPRPAARGGASSPGGRTGLRSSGGSHGRCRLPRRRSRRTACM
jgi:hypothetical protein